MIRQDKIIFATLFFSIFTNVTGVGIVVPLLPVYAHTLGASGFYIALIFSSFSFSRTFFLPYFGRRSDIIGRKPYIVIGLFGYAIISMAFVQSTDVRSLIGLRFIQGIASAMIMPAVQAYIGDITPKNHEGETMGLFNMSAFIGLSIGPLMGGVINDHFSLESAFMCMGIFSLIACLSSLIFLPPTNAERVITRGREPVAWKILLKDRMLAGLFVFRFAHTACIGIIWGFLPVFAKNEFSLSASAIGLLVMLGVLVSGIVQTPMGRIADRRDKSLMTLSGGLIVCISMFSFEWVKGFSDMVYANILFGMGGGMLTASLMAISVQKGHQTKAMGSVMALMTMSQSLGMMMGSLIAGWMMDVFELRQAFSFGSLVMLIGVIIFFICLNRDSHD